MDAWRRRLIRGHGSAEELSSFSGGYPSVKPFKFDLVSKTLLLIVGLSLSACGSDDDDDKQETTSPPPARGSLLQNPPELLSTVTSTDLLIKLNTDTETQQWLAIGGTPDCDIAFHKIRYVTVGGAGEATEASAALMVPTGSDPSCSGPRPVLLYAHGTTTDKAYNIADINDTDNGEGLLMAAFFAGQGYIVVAPNYAGYDTSTLPYHPYLNADQQSKDMIDALVAAKSALPTSSAAQTSASARLFISGYSQGGYVAMATHRAMQTAGIAVTASAPMSGPYALAAFADAVFYGRVNGGAPIFMTLMLNAYQKSYGNLYSNVGDVVEAPYAAGFESLLPTAQTRGELYSQGKLPQYALFSTEPPAPEFASDTPPTEPAQFAALFALGFSAEHLITNSFRLQYLQDAQANPDGGWPTTTSGVPSASPAQPLRQALKRNDLRDWTPTAPVLLCGGNSDPVVFWMNTQLQQGYWAANAPSAQITVLDVDSPAGSGDPYADLKTGFTVLKDGVAAAAVAGGATDGGSAAVLESYHGGLVAPFCLAAVKSFFGDVP